MEKTELRRNILRLLGENGRLTAEEIAERIDAAAAEVENEIRILERENIIIGYRAILSKPPSRSGFTLTSMIALTAFSGSSASLKTA